MSFDEMEEMIKKQMKTIEYIERFWDNIQRAGYKRIIYDYLTSELFEKLELRSF